MGEVLTNAAAEREGFHGGGRGMGGIGIVGYPLMHVAEQRVEQVEPVRIGVSAETERKFVDGGVRLGERRAPQVQAWGEAFDGTADDAVRVLRLDLASHKNGQLAQWVIG